jgi:hypothetical protein
MGDRQRRAMISVPASLLVLLYSLPLWANPSDDALVDLEQGGLTNIEPRARAVDLPPRIDQRLPALALDPTQVSVYVHQVDADRPDLAFNADSRASRRRWPSWSPASPRSTCSARSIAGTPKS